MWRWSAHHLQCLSCLQCPPDWTSCSRDLPAPTVHRHKELQPRFVCNRDMDGQATAVSQPVNTRASSLLTPPVTPASTPDRSHSQRQASTSASSPKRAASSSPSRAPLPGWPGHQTPEETPSLHPRPARLGFQLHGTTPSNQGSVSRVLHPAEQRNRRRGKQTSGSYKRCVLLRCKVRSCARTAWGCWAKLSFQ